MRAVSSFLLLAIIGLSQFAEAQNHVVIAISTTLDGKEKVLHDTRIVVSGSKIIAIDRNASRFHCEGYAAAQAIPHERKG